MPIAGSYAVSLLPGLGGIELNETVVRDHPYQERAVQSMWAVNGSMRAEDGASPRRPPGRIAQRRESQPQGRMERNAPPL